MRGRDYAGHHGSTGGWAKALILRGVVGREIGMQWSNEGREGGTGKVGGESAVPGGGSAPTLPPSQETCRGGKEGAGRERDGGSRDGGEVR